MLFGATALVAVVLIAGAWVGSRAWLAYGELQEARSGATKLQEKFAENPASIIGDIEDLGEHTARAADLTSDPIWRAAEIIPWAGPNLEAFRVTADSLDTVVRAVGAPLVEHVDAMQSSLALTDGRVALEPLVEMRSASANANTQMKKVVADMHGIKREKLVPQLADAVAEFTELLQPVSVGVSAVSDTTALLPGMLGLGGSRDTLLLFLNNAEVRSTMGIPGALALLNANDGRIALTQQASTLDFPVYPEPVARLSPDLRGTYGDKPALWVQNVTMLPEFPLTGELAVTMWERNFGVRPQAVVAVDPVTLSYILEATGPISLESGESLSSDNAVDLLMHEVYVRYEDPADQDAFFADASARVFTAVSSGDFEVQKFVKALTRGAAEDRIKLWSSVSDEQSVIDGTSLAGTLTTARSTTPKFTMQLNDGTGAKMDYFLTTKATLTGDLGPNSESDEIVVRYTMSNTAPADAGISLPGYITGGGNYGVEPGSIATVARLFAPGGFNLLSQQVDGSSENAGESLQLLDRSVAQWNPTLAPGESRTIELRYRVEIPNVHAVEWRQTPTFSNDISNAITY
ncbi:DUF4012 domain-containing protein [Leucobacter sp. USHLN153]|uniref:DUF4012 domain-containing protein n=1 Tax=Leucobacter sp. USHLN153 TaxID=3081268 RepID=UPI0030174AFF